MPKLILKFKDSIVSELEIVKPTVTVGRKSDNDIIIDNPAVSNHHCRIVLTGKTYEVEDLGSTNGTTLNGEKVSKSGLHDNDEIGIAKHTVVFVEEAPAEEEPAPVKAAPKARKAASKEGSACLRVLKGGVGSTEFELRGTSIYIGTADRAQIRIKAGGLFTPAPEIAASVHRRESGYVLVAVEDGFPVLNGSKVSGQHPLKDGDIVEFGETALQFFLRDG
ncbi:MAG: FHA domain-containing protein [Elusimicrobiota bacterium]